MVDWLVEVALEFRLSDDSLFLAVALLDRLFACMPVACEKKNAQLMAEVCLLIASKIVDSSRIVASEFVTISDGAYTTAQIKETELSVLRTLDFDVFQPTPLCFLRLALPLLLEPLTPTTSAQSGAQKEESAASAGTLKAHTNLLHLCFYLCELFLCSPSYPLFSPLAVALSAINLARHGSVQHASGTL